MSTYEPMVVGVPRETKSDEGRVALTPDGVRELRSQSTPVLVEAGAGVEAGMADEEYAAAGAEVVTSASEVWERSGLICKVKEPQGEELDHLRPDLTLITFLHLAAYDEVADALISSGTTAIAYETVQLEDGSLPLLAPMSEVAGRMSVQVGAHLLENPTGGRGVLLGGVAGVAPARVVVLGAGNVGWNAAMIVAGMGAHVDLLDRDVDRLRALDHHRIGRITTLASNRGAIERAVAEADLVVGAVLVAGGRAPVLVDEDMVKAMRAGSVIVDIAIDQGGSVATSRETTHQDPFFVKHDVLHYAVGNMPGAVPVTATHALTAVTLPHLAALARLGVKKACHQDPALAAGVNIHEGEVRNAAVAEALDRTHVPLD